MKSTGEHEDSTLTVKGGSPNDLSALYSVALASKQRLSGIDSIDNPLGPSRQLVIKADNEADLLTVTGEVLDEGERRGYFPPPKVAEAKARFSINSPAPANAVSASQVAVSGQTFMQHNEKCVVARAEELGKAGFTTDELKTFKAAADMEALRTIKYDLGVRGMTHVFEGYFESAKEWNPDKTVTL